MSLGPSTEDLERLAADLVRRRREIDAAELAWSVDAAILVAHDYHISDGSVTGVDWIRHNCKMSRGQAADRVCVGEQIGRLIDSMDAMVDGDIGFGHLVLMARTSEAVKAGFDEAQLLAKAKEQSVGRFHFTCDNYRHACDPDEFATEAENLFEQRELTMRRRRDGLVTIWGRLDPIGAATLRNALTPLAKRRGKDDRRTFKQRLHDAAVEHASGAQPAHVNVTIAAETLLGLPGAPAGDIEQCPPVAMKTIERLTCDCSIRRIVLDPKAVVMEVGRARRVVSPAERQALEARDLGCVWPRCERPAAWCEAHHLIHWARGGTTDLTNQVLLCGFHHRLVHEGGWQIVKLDGDQIMVLRPPPTFPNWARGPDEARAA
jgi:hypothetical protein